MQLDDLTIKALALELDRELSGSRIDKIAMPRGDMILFSIYHLGKNRRLLVCCGASARMHLTENRYENPQEPYSTCIFYRKRLLGGRILGFFKEEGERVMGMRIIAEDELGDAHEYTLYCELIGRRQNVILTDSDDVIINCMKQFSPEVWPERPVVPGFKRKKPASRPGISISDPGLEEKLKELDLSQDPGKALASAFWEISPKVGRIVCEKTEGTLASRIASLKAEPWVLFENGAAVDFSPVELPGWEKADSFSQALDMIYRDKEEEATRKNIAASLIKSVDSACKKVMRRTDNQRRELFEAEDRKKVKTTADLIMSNLWAIKPGAKSACVTDYFKDPPEEITIALDPDISPSDNAQLLYKKYGRLKRAAEVLKERIEIGENELRYLESVRYSLSLVTTMAEADAIKDELIEAGYIKGRRAKKLRELPAAKKETSPSGFTVVWGRNNRENDVIRKSSQKNDLWFHVKDTPGSHVILKTGGAPCADEDIGFASELAVRYSSVKSGYRAAVDWCPVKNVKKIPGAGPGMVTYDGYKTVIVTAK